MDSRKRTARIAGGVYLIVVLTGIFHLIYVPSKLIDWENPAATLSNLMTSEILFRLSILSGLVCFIAFLILPLVLYRLLKPVNKIHALMMVILAVISVPISFVNMLNKFSVLTWISKSNYLNSFEPEQIQAQVMLHLDYYNNGVQVASIFWGLWLFPFGYLVFKSGFLPKVLGVLLMVGCFGYLFDFCGSFLFPDYNASGISTFVTIPDSLGEIGICLWLLIVGIKDKPISTLPNNIQSVKQILV